MKDSIGVSGLAGCKEAESPVGRESPKQGAAPAAPRDDAWHQALDEARRVAFMAWTCSNDPAETGNAIIEALDALRARPAAPRAAQDNRAVGNGRNMYYEGRHDAEDSSDTAARLKLVGERDALRAEVAHLRARPAAPLPEPVAQVVDDIQGGNKRVIFNSTKALHETPLWTKLYAAAPLPGELPPLTEFGRLVWVEGEDGVRRAKVIYAASQMREYARAALSAHQPEAKQ